MFSYTFAQVEIVLPLLPNLLMEILAFFFFISFVSLKTEKLLEP